MLEVGRSGGSIRLRVDGVGSPGASRGDARLPSRRRVDGQDDPRPLARRAVRDGVEPGVRTPLHGDRPPRGRGVDELGVHAHRPHALLVRGLPRPSRRRGCCSPTPTRSRRRSSTRSTSARPQPGSTSSSPGRTTSGSCAGSMSPGGTTGFASSRSSGGGCTSGTSSTRAPAGAPWLVVEGPLEERVAAVSTDVDGLLG